MRQILSTSVRSLPAPCRIAANPRKPTQRNRRQRSQSHNRGHRTMTEEERQELEVVLGHHFERAERLDRALTHRSHRQSSSGIDNERLEFLGDRVLGLVASERLCRTFPEWDSGQLSKGLARLVSASSIHAAAKRLKLGSHLRLGPGEEKT